MSNVVISQNLIRVLWVIGVAIWLVTFASSCDACPTCKDAVTDGQNHAAITQGYFWSIVFMMSMPFLIFGGLGAYFYLQVRKARALATGDAHDPVAQHSGRKTGTPARHLLQRS